MQPVLIVRHVPHEGPGYLADFLSAQGIPWRLARIDAREPLPEGPDGLAGLVFMGGPMSVNDALPWIPRAVTLIRQALERDLPVLGHCLGGQLIAKALGAPVTANRVPEIGWFRVRAVAGRAARDWLGDLAAEFPVFHWHGETFAIPAGATRILESRRCANQGFVLGRTLALQCHVEMTPALVRAWAAQHADAPSPTVQSAQAMTADLTRRVRALHRVADVLYHRWIQGLR